MQELTELLLDIQGIKDIKLQSKMLQILSLIEQGKVDMNAFTSSLSATLQSFDIKRSEISKELSKSVFYEVINGEVDKFLKSDTSGDYEEYLQSVRLDIKNRGKEAVLDLLDNCVYDLTEPRLRSILKENAQFLKEIKSKNKRYKLYERKRRTYTTY